MFAEPPLTPNRAARSPEPVLPVLPGQRVNDEKPTSARPFAHSLPNENI